VLESASKLRLITSAIPSSADRPIAMYGCEIADGHARAPEEESVSAIAKRSAEPRGTPLTALNDEIYDKRDGNDTGAPTRLASRQRHEREWAPDRWA